MFHMSNDGNIELQRSSDWSVYGLIFLTCFVLQKELNPLILIKRFET